jgi:hypothetical protein
MLVLISSLEVDGDGRKRFNGPVQASDGAVLKITATTKKRKKNERTQRLHSVPNIRSLAINLHR